VTIGTVNQCSNAVVASSGTEAVPTVANKRRLAPIAVDSSGTAAAATPAVTATKTVTINDANLRTGTGLTRAMHAAGETIV
jgi:hypothetical protein